MTGVELNADLERAKEIGRRVMDLFNEEQVDEATATSALAACLASVAGMVIEKEQDLEKAIANQEEMLRIVDKLREVVEQMKPAGKEDVLV